MHCRSECHLASLGECQLPDRGLHQGGGRAERSNIAREHKVPLVHDLSSGTLLDLKRFGLPHRIHEVNGGSRSRMLRALWIINIVEDLERVMAEAV
jgi:hypothetical protein